MSLFPAYSSAKNDERQAVPSTSSSTATNTIPDGSNSWLSQSSFFPELASKIDVTNIESSSDNLSKEHSLKKKRKKKHSHERKKRKMEKHIIEKAHERMVKLLADDPVLYIDLKGSRNNCLIPTLMKNDAPFYKKPRRCYFHVFRKLDKQNKWRYYNISQSYFESDTTICKNTNAVENSDIIVVGKTETKSVSLEGESQFSKMTALYNQQLLEDPHNEELWLKYVDFQDEVKEFENLYKKVKANKGAVIEKQLSIIDKALSHNSFSEILLRRKVDILSKADDLDKFSEELYSILRQDFGNLYLWTRYISITQCTVARCTIPKVMSLYASAIEKINFMQKHGVLTTELQFINLFTRCGLFLRQSGLWEQLCMLIRLNLQLNLSTSACETYKVEINLPEEEIKQLEDRILMCGLPIYNLWLRLEKLRQRVHWYPVLNAECEDPQRVVVPTDVTDFLKPITTNSLKLRLTFITLFLLKVPFMPLRDTVFRCLDLPEIPWHLDSAEMLLSTFCSTGITQGRFENFEETVISSLNDLVTYPQYAKEDLGQLEYLDFIQTMFKKISQNLPLQFETIILVWWLRFERALLIAGKQPTNCKKRLKSMVKNLLKEERHRNNLSLFIEYALLEKELNESTEKCLKILDTALLMHPLKKHVFHVSQTKNTLTQLYRVTAELLISSRNKEKCLRLLIALSLSEPEKEVQINEENVRAASEEFRKITEMALLEDFTDEFDLERIQPQFLIEWATCEAWFLMLTKSLWSACSFLEELIHKFPRRQKENPITVETYFRELLLESLIIILHYQCTLTNSSYNILNEHLYTAIEEFPNNMLFLSTLADIETKQNSASPYWKLANILISKNDSHITKLILILLCQKKANFYQNAYRDSLTFFGLGGSDEEVTGYHNIIKSLYLRLTREESTRQCPLFWMIYLQDCSRRLSDQKCKDVFYMAVAECPWIKELYMEGASILPDHVSQIQDLMIEKEMRIHITNDEIDILRDV